jgi:translocation protein SEC63
MGIALPPWIVEAHNNVWVLGTYGVLFGIGLPVIVVCTHSFLELSI